LESQRLGQATKGDPNVRTPRRRGSAKGPKGRKVTNEAKHLFEGAWARLNGREKQKLKGGAGECKKRASRESISYQHIMLGNSSREGAWGSRNAKRKDARDEKCSFNAVGKDGDPLSVTVGKNGGARDHSFPE